MRSQLRGAQQMALKRNARADVVQGGLHHLTHVLKEVEETGACVLRPATLYLYHLLVLKNQAKYMVSFNEHRLYEEDILQ